MIRTLVVGSVLICVTAYIFKILLTLDINKRVYNHRPGACRQVEGVQYGSEDIALLEDEGIAFVTSGIVYLAPRKKEVKGQIFLYDFNQKDGWKAEPLKIIGEYDQENFHPHGISHVPTATGTRLFVISHSNTFEHSVWVFDWKKTNSRQLQLVKVIRDEKFIRPNDLVAVSDEAFILTNDGAGQTVFTNFLEMVSFYPSGSVVYYDGTTSTYMISRTVSPNGVILTKDRKYLFISHVNYETVTVYKIGTNYRSLSRVVDVPLLTSADNFYVDKTGALWTGAHPVMKDARAHLKDFDDPVPIAPSQVLRIAFSKDYKSWEITEPFVDDGRLISASSIAVPYKNQLLIGSVCRQLVHCDVTLETV
ncbi:hypothetical protein Q1695_010313 [Nippostrongylus brasiliensis]|nr:hypothetical protein Q1695_010313 [Nippostrongylus brasiliensis]